MTELSAYVSFQSRCSNINIEYSFRQTWRSIFYISAGLSALCFIGALISFDADEHSKETDKRVDWLGAFLVTAGLVLVFFVLSQGEIAPEQWATPCKPRYCTQSVSTK